MPVTIPAPAELDLGDYAAGDEFELPVTFSLTETGDLYATAVAGAPISVEDVPEDEEMPPQETSFEQAVEAGMMDQ